MGIFLKTTARPYSSCRECERIKRMQGCNRCHCVRFGNRGTTLAKPFLYPNAHDDLVFLEIHRELMLQISAQRPPFATFSGPDLVRFQLPSNLRRHDGVYCS